MSKIHFIQDNYLNESLGIMYLSSYIKEHGHEVELSFLNHGRETLLADIRVSKPDIVGFSLMVPQEAEYLEITKLLKQEFGVMVIWGGPHCTFMPERIASFDEVDLFAVGEGEEVMLNVMNQLDGDRDFSNITGLWHRKEDRSWVPSSVGQLIDLNTLPPPDRELYYSRSKLARNFSLKRVMTGRGCPYRCNYCFEPSWNDLYKGKGNTLRRLTVEKAIDEIKELVAKYPTKHIHFSDDTFNINRDTWVKEFLLRYKKEIGLPFTANIAIGMVDEEFVKNMVNAGCKGVAFGLESGVERIRREILQKDLTNEQILAATDLFKKYRLRSETFNMVGLPTETLDDAIETLRFNKQAGVYLVNFNIMKIYKGTKLAEYVKERGLQGEEGALIFKPLDPNNEQQYSERLLWMGFYLLKVPFLLKYARSVLKSRIAAKLHFLIIFTYWPYMRFYRVPLWKAVLYFLASRKVFMSGVGGKQDDDFR